MTQSQTQIHAQTYAQNYAIDAGSLRLAADARGQLCATSLQDASGRELLYEPGHFLLIDHLPVQVLSMDATRISFARADLAGELRVDARRFQLVLRNTAVEERAFRVETPILAYAWSPATRIFHPNIGGSLTPRSQPIQAIYPAEATICALFYSEHDAPSFGFGFLNREQRRITLDNGPTFGCARMRAAFEHLPIPAGAEVTLPPFYVTVGREWDTLLAPYTDYAAGFPKRTDTPAWVHDSAWFFRDLPIHPHSLARWDDLQRAIDEGFSHAAARGASPVFWMTPWWKTCERLHGRWYFDHTQGDFTAAPELVERVVAEVHRRGGRIVAYTNVTALGEYSDLYQERADEVLLKPFWNHPVRNGDYPMFMYCPASDGTRAQWRRIVDYMFGTLRLDGIFLDQAGGGNKALDCHCSTHGHAIGIGYGEGMLGLLGQIRAHIKAINPEAVIFGELAQDARDHLVDFWLWHWGWSGVVGQQGYAEGAVFFKHVIPDAILLDQENGQVPDAAEAVRAVGHGVWMNTYDTMRGGDHNTAAWNFYRQHRALLQTRPIPLASDSSAVSAVLFGPLEGVAVISLLCPRGSAGVVGAGVVGVKLPPGLVAQRVQRWRPEALALIEALTEEHAGWLRVPVSAGGGELLFINGL